MAFAFLRYSPIVEWHLGPLSISPHGLGTAIGFLAGARLLLSTTRRLAIPDQLVYAALTRGGVGAVIGARFAYVVNHLGSFDSPLEWVQIWNGGISLLGGIAGGLALGLPVIRRAGVRLWAVLDGVAPGLALGIAIGRIGDLVVADHLGKPTRFALGYVCPDVDTASPCAAPVGQAVHQPALYDLIAAALILSVLFALRSRRRTYDGFLALLFGALYGTARLVEDFFRVDETHGTGLTGSQWAALTVASMSTRWLLTQRRTPSRRPPRRREGEARRSRSGSRRERTRSRAMTETFDAIVIGMGPAGEAVAGDLAQAGLTVLGIDRKLVGGECPYWGCIPSKMMIRAADLLAEARRVDGIAGTATVTPDWEPVARRIRDEATDDWDDRVAVERFEGKGGTFVRGTGWLVAPRTVAVGDRTFSARRAIVLATGTEPAIPPIPGLAEVPYWTNRDVIEAKELPTSLVVLGGGAIGVELAQALARFGVTVTVIEALDRLAPLETPAAGDLLARMFADEGIEVVTGVAVERVEREGARIAAGLADGRTVAGAQLLVATGRRTNLPELGVATIGIDDSQRFVPVDDNLRVTDGVWAVGDLTGKGAFTHVGMYQARLATADILGAPHEPADYRALPRVTFTDPEIGSVGLTPAMAAEAGIDVRVGTTLVPHTARGWIHKAGNDGFIELVEDRARGLLVGATAVGPNGGEVLGLLTLAVHAEVPVERLRQMIYAYPTFHRGIEDALRDLVS